MDAGIAARAALRCAECRYGSCFDHRTCASKKLKQAKGKVRQHLVFRRENFNHKSVDDRQVIHVDAYAVNSLVGRNISGNADHLDGFRSDLAHLQAVIGLDSELELQQEILRIAGEMNGGSRQVKDDLAQRGRNTKAEVLGKLFQALAAGSKNSGMQTGGDVLRAFQFRAFNE